MVKCIGNQMDFVELILCNEYCRIMRCIRNRSNFIDTYGMKIKALFISSVFHQFEIFACLFTNINIFSSKICSNAVVHSQLYPMKFISANNIVHLTVKGSNVLSYIQVQCANVYKRRTITQSVLYIQKLQSFQCKIQNMLTFYTVEQYFYVLSQKVIIAYYNKCARVLQDIVYIVYTLLEKISYVFTEFDYSFLYFFNKAFHEIS